MLDRLACIVILAEGELCKSRHLAGGGGCHVWAKAAVLAWRRNDEESGEMRRCVNSERAAYYCAANIAAEKAGKIMSASKYGAAKEVY